MRGLRKWFLLSAFAMVPLPAFGQACGGFSDVDPGEFYCNNVEWLKNRAVTLGCVTPVGAYCENDFVLRSQMAAFMNRLGNVLTPLILRSIDTADDVTFDPPFVMCEDQAVAAAAYPRQASFTATVMNFNATATKTVQGRLVYSTNAGMTWTPTGDAVMWQTVDPAERSTLALTGGPLNLDPGQAYQFGIRLETNAVGAIVDAECQLNVRVENRNGTASPF